MKSYLNGIAMELVGISALFAVVAGLAAYASFYIIAHIIAHTA